MAKQSFCYKLFYAKRSRKRQVSMVILFQLGISSLFFILLSLPQKKPSKQTNKKQKKVKEKKKEREIPNNTVYCHSLQDF